MKKLIVLLILTASGWAGAEDSNDLFAAAIMGKNARIEALLAQGVDVNGLTAGGRTALMGASYQGNIGIVKTLLAYGADVNIADAMGTTALMDALAFGDATIVNLLIAAGADINAQDKQNVTVLGRAKKIGNEQIIKILEQAGAVEQPVIIEETNADNPPIDANAEGADKASEKPPAEKQETNRQKK